MDQASSHAQDSLGYSLYDYLNQGYFSKDSLLCTTQAHSSSFGMSGSPMPYSLRSDNAVSIILLACFCLIIILGTQSYGLFTRQLKMLFRAPRDHSDSVRETSGEMNVMMVFVVINSLLLGIFSNLIVTEYVTTHFIIDSNALIVLLLSGAFLVFFFGKWFVQSLINIVFYGNKKNLQFLREQVFITASMCLFTYPMVMLLVYFNLSLESAITYFTIIIFFQEMLSFYKCWLIFFGQKGLFLQNILYFCALEIIPLLTFVSSMVLIINNLKINF